MNPQQDPNTQSNQTPVGPQTPNQTAGKQPSAGYGPPVAVNPNSTQNTLQIAEIRDGIVIMNDGSYRSVIMAQSINFDLMSPQERESVEYAYQGFLNSLYFPIQIFIRSQKIDMRPYLERLEKMRVEQDNMLLGLLMEDYVDYITALVQQTNIMDKQFYIVVPYYSTVDIKKPVEAGRKVLGGFAELFKVNKGAATETVHINEQDLEKAKQELRNRVQSVIGGLHQMGVQSVPLDTQELIELYYDVYNPDTATRQTLRNINDVSVPIIEKGEGASPQSSPGNGGLS
jgi:type IV secretory pathway VirB4 component